ncbi:hypothetical protein [Sorangium sp. So ce887]|uniref:hypothetical protein n=1 Tax=Sorangium sp. So ce887 TaxID=3133324 RepID=UPI003F624012
MTPRDLALVLAPLSLLGAGATTRHAHLLPIGTAFRHGGRPLASFGARVRPPQ